jgi:hypothetical protein
MSRYEPLAQFLDKRSEPIWQTNFDEIEHILGFPLPPSAHRYPAWWANQRGKGHSQVAGWRESGWRTCKIDLERRMVTFEREAATAAFGNDHLIERARIVAGIDDTEDAVAKALRAYTAREAAAFLNGLGGTMPDFRPAPRDRSPM